MIRFNPRRLGMALLPLWLTAAGLLWPHAAFALTQMQYIKQFDWASLGVSVGIAIVGGTAPTLVALLTDQFVLTNVLQRTLKDIGIAAVNGAVFFVLVVVIESWWNVPDGVTFAGVLCAGWARREFIQLVSGGVRQIFMAGLGRLVAMVRGAPP